MSRLLRRLYTTTTTTTTTTAIPTAAETAALFQSQASSRPPTTLTQTLDPHHHHHLTSTLSRRPAPSPTAALPACHHLIYFTPSAPATALGHDGSDTTHSPPAPFTRRMWAGGELCWAGAANRLRLGQRARETSRLRSVVAKRTRAGDDMLVVGVEKTVENEGGWAVTDRRNWIFRAGITVPSEPAARPALVPFPDGRYVRDLVMTPVTLFRFSALTFNGHKIHYNREWCREVEGHRDLVVHGPLNLVHMVDFWRDVMGGGDDEFVPKRVVYRATTPLYAGEPYRIVMDEEREGVSEVRIVDAYGIVSMMGSIERFQ